MSSYCIYFCLSLLIETMFDLNCTGSGSDGRLETGAGSSVANMLTLMLMLSFLSVNM